MKVNRNWRWIGACIALTVFGQSANAGESSRFVVLDGDTVELDGRVIDLAGIDAPEFGQQCRRGGATVDCGMIARTQLLDLTAAAEVVCDVEGATQRAGWPTVTICSAGGYDLSEGMLHTGWALAADGSDMPAVYRSIAAAAQQAGRGLWSFTFVEPWEWRQGRRLPISGE